jgi:hypothetical protein
MKVTTSRWRVLMRIEALAAKTEAGFATALSTNAGRLRRIRAIAILDTRLRADEDD